MARAIHIMVTCSFGPRSNWNWQRPELSGRTRPTGIAGNALTSEIKLSGSAFSSATLDAGGPPLSGDQWAAKKPDEFSPGLSVKHHTASKSRLEGAHREARE